jgi:outer membrane immunogenic protein
MNRFTLNVGACVLALAMASPSFAADMPGRFPAPLSIAPAFNWAGLYAGLNAGYGWGTADWNSSLGTGTSSPGGSLLGGTVGFNMQTGAFVYGVEGDIDASWMRDSSSTGPTCGAAGCGVQNSWLGTARGRVGYAFDRALFYVTAGGAFTDVQMSAGGTTATANRAGWAAGLGLEYAVLGPWSAKVDYLYADLGSAGCGVSACGADTTVNFKTSVIRLGVNYRFW